MQSFPSTAAFVGCAICCALAVAPVATAATSPASSVSPGSTCQLSIPTTETGVRPKASGFRNESATTGNFVICPIVSAVTPDGGKTFTVLMVVLQSLDAVARDVSCTAVVGADGIGDTPISYSSKTGRVNASGDTVFYWRPAEFGQPDNGHLPIGGSALSSITCNLPPHMSIRYTTGQYEYDVGT
jgi:hypothetical protein